MTTETTKRHREAVYKKAHKLHCITSLTTLKNSSRVIKSKYSLKKIEVTMNRLIVLALFVVISAVCAQQTSHGITRASSLSSRLLQDLKNNVHTRKRRSTTPSYLIFDNRSGRIAQLWYRDMTNRKKGRTKFVKLKPDSTIQVNTRVIDIWGASDVKTNANLMVNGRYHFRPEANTINSRTLCVITRPGQKKPKIKAFIETLVVVDKSVRDSFSSDSEVQTYVEVLFNLATKVFKHASLTQHALKINMVPTKIIVRKEKQTPPFDMDDGGTNVYRACRVMNKLGNYGARRFDHKMYLTKKAFGAGGYSRSNAMCSRYSSCSIVLDHGFHAAFLVAHEVAHSLGLSHGNFPQHSRNIMAGMVDSQFNDHRWSPKSQHALLRNIRKFSCLGNKPHGIKKHRFPGENYSFQRQCDLEFDESYTAWQPTRWQPGDPCKVLRCRMPGRWYSLSKTTGSPALEGTKCGENKWCVKGKCEDKLSGASVMGRH